MGIGTMSFVSRASLPSPRVRIGDRSLDRVSSETPDDLVGAMRPLFGQMARLSRRILQDDGLADDAIQETLVTFWARGQLPPNPRAWLLQAVTLRSLHLARTGRRRRKHERQASLGRPERDLRDDPSRSLDHQDLSRALHEALERVADDHRAVFLLWAVEEMDYAGIAATLQIPIGTVRSRLSRSRQAIRESLAGRLDDHHLGQSPRPGSHAEA